MGARLSLTVPLPVDLTYTPEWVASNHHLLHISYFGVDEVCLILISFHILAHAEPSFTPSWKILKRGYRSNTLHIKSADPILSDTSFLGGIGVRELRKLKRKAKGSR